MSEPSRLCEEPSSDGFERALLRSATLDREPEDGAARALAALGVATAAVGVGMAGASTTVHAASVTGASLATKIAAVVLATSCLAGAVVAVARSGDSPSPGPVTRASAAATTDVLPPSPPVETVPPVESRPPMAAEPTVVSVMDLPPSPSSAESAASARSARRPAPIAASAAPPPKVSVSDEIALIDQARAAVTAGDMTRAEKALDTYDARFANGTLVLEAKLARIELHLARGEDAQARDLGERFLREHPQTAYERRVRALLRRARTAPTIVQ